ncbi:hypothetical protein ASPWEDRAFT_104673 [Aspergillus wentii DTO 134E9]|uniref:Zn(2)-C6 fungal-type domain-containing protein n=1 Tax=Aspergillus wentii DTO 134E9 TaxID=1073089 RepID=A0A1L9RW78_ASPWE|nr:uncharacterized protein ASPWEDRAFT_104673 [Aspergillus wentii DTO 134E9]OJJ39189.1 hypothetical protein ASPWEDRAFT_104673 [Aspergillus wentii DTO 134E9]
MLAESNDMSPGGEEAPKLRTACENCRQSKVKCNLSNKDTCIRCLRHGLQCRYGFANRSGKPKGSKNRATLKKLGQLPESQATSMHAWEKENMAFAVDYTFELTEQHGSYHTDQSTEDGSNAAVNASMFVGDSCADPYPLEDMMASTDLGYPPGSLSPTFLQREFITKGETSCPLAMHIPYTAQPTCACVATQLFYLNQLSYMATDPTHLRLDHSLQTIKSTISACRTFFHCPSCPKDNTNLLLSASTLDMTLQLLGYWIPNEVTPHPTLQDERVHIRYGHYEMSYEESRRIRHFLIRGLLFQCREVLGMARAAVDICIGPRKGMLNLEMEDPLYRIVLGCEGVVDVFDRYMSLRECICS